MEEKLAPTHLAPVIPETEDLKQEVADALPEKKEEEPKIKPDDPRNQTEYTFDFNWKDRNGKVWEGKFTNKILTIADKQNAGLLQAKLSGGMPIGSLDDVISELNIIISHLTYSLTNVPDWAQDLRALTSVDLVQEIYTEVIQHEAIFCGLGELEIESKS